MKLGITLAKFDWKGNPERTGENLKRIVGLAEEVEIDSLWVMDHFFQLEPMLGKAEDEMHEAYTILGYMAAVTEKVGLGTLVTGVHYRNPGFLVKQMTSLDVLSGGRGVFGIGAGWYERESEGLGFGMPSVGARFEMLEETLQIALQMWEGDTSAYNGKQYQMEEPICSPLPVSQPRPPIMIGGEGEKKTLRLVARYADACNLFGHAGAEHVAAKQEVLKGHCEAEDRDYDEIEKTVLWNTPLKGGEMDVEASIEYCQELAEVGVDHVIVGLPEVDTLKPIEDWGRVKEAVKGL